MHEETVRRKDDEEGKAGRRQRDGRTESKFDSTGRLELKIVKERVQSHRRRE